MIRKSIRAMSLRTVGLGVLSVGVALQFLPLGYPRSNPPLGTDLAWSSPETRDLFFRACGDCHSNETRWPWYSHVAPVKWIVTGHVRHGRGTLNVSDWNEERFGEAALEASSTIRDGSMPPSRYLRLHRDARLNASERDSLIAGLDEMDSFRVQPR